LLRFNKPKRSVDRVFLHCTAYAGQDLVGDQLVDAVKSWHLARNFSDIGYHYLIDKDGELLLGRDLARIPAAQYMHNSKTIAICLDGLHSHQFTKLQFITLYDLVRQINNAYSVITFHGHCEVSNKTCPVFNYKEVLNLTESGRFKGQLKKHLSQFCIGERILSLTCVGDDVRFLQKCLPLIVDGIFGRQTYTAVIEFQIAQDLEPDGIVGPITWKEILKVHGGGNA
jgi:N-acetylmuramoyl-L-alanine amidase